ncbi:MAG: stage III sporulation protein AC [Clostridia bacterium]|nr:stage III sporulation protein AC [Clostridia bacterium]MBQ3870347.1 stage III sporulation protein AC [Clostridia bacterium]
MDIGLLIKVAGVGLLVAVAYVILSKSGRDEMAMLLSLCGIVIILIMLVGQISDLLSSIRAGFGL